MPAANPLPNPIESIMAMFLMSLTSFGDYYPQFEKTMHDHGSKVLSLIFSVLTKFINNNKIMCFIIKFT